MALKWRQQTAASTSQKFTNSGGWVTSNSSYTREAQHIVTFNHPYRLLGKVSTDLGGPFTSFKMLTGPLPSEVHLSGGLTAGGSTAYQTKGVVLPPEARIACQNGSFDSQAKIKDSSPGLASENELIALGTTAIARCNPTSPAWDGATAVAELVSGMPSIPGRDLSLSGNYLNYQFGLAPTVSDIQTARDAARKSEEIIAQLERDSGSNVRRGYEFPPSETEGSTVSGSFQPICMTGYTPTAYEVSRGTYTKSVRTTTDTRFKGSFTYHLPEKGSWRRKIAELDSVYGIRPGVDTAWNLVPYSWLADWYGNMGDVITNLQSFALDGNVMRYGYVTRKRKTVTTWNFSYPARLVGSKNVFSTVSGSFQVSSETLQRIPAHPFGFGVQQADLSPSRLAILAALGLNQV